MSTLRDVQIGITTKDRWEQLRHTLDRLQDFGVSDLRLIVVDDGSAEPCPYDVTEWCPSATLLRHEESAGLIVRRNEIAGLMSGRYYLSVDDDSYPVEGSLAEAVAFMRSQDRTAALSFPIYNPVQERYQVRSLHPNPYQVQSFTGCAHLLDLERFQEVGGYRDELVHFKEEVDLTVRWYQEGCLIYQFPDLLFHHRETLTGRNWYRMDYYGARNNVLWNDWYVPGRYQLVKKTRNALSRMLLLLKTRRKGHWRGHVAGLRDRRRFRHHRLRMSVQAYKGWKALPTS